MLELCPNPVSNVPNCVNTIVEGCILVAGGVHLISKATNKKSFPFFEDEETLAGKAYPGRAKPRPKSVPLASASIPHSPAGGASFPSLRSSWGPLELKPVSSKAALSPLLSGGHPDIFSHTMPKLPSRRRAFLAPPRASSKVVPYPKMTEKPKWWWRTLACLPYLMPLHEPCLYAHQSPWMNSVCILHPCMDDFEFMTCPFWGALWRLPRWFLMVYSSAVYLGVVKKKEWPHFFRYHMVMGMLLDSAMQILRISSSWMPLASYWGKPFWTVVSFVFLFTVLECIRCALAGMYADVPFVSDAAYIHTTI